MSADSESARPSTADSCAILGLLAEEIRTHSDVALRDYEVRSGIPLLGSLIVWIRRNLTSHLREPYLDLIIERQVFLNMRVADWIGRMMRSWKSVCRRQTELEERIRALEDQAERLVQGGKK